MKEIAKNNKSFEDIKHMDNEGNEYWLARELQLVLDYTEWRKFENVIIKAMQSCENSGISASDHFGGAAKMISLGKGATKNIPDYKIKNNISRKGVGIDERNR